MARILLVGEDKNLLTTRALLLSSWETETVSTDEAKEALNTARFDAVIVGQLVKEQSARELIAVAKQADTRVLLIRYPEDAREFESETHILDLYESPAWLQQWATATLGRPAVDGKGAKSHAGKPDGMGDALRGQLESGAS